MKSLLLVISRTGSYEESLARHMNSLLLFISTVSCHMKSLLSYQQSLALHINSLLLLDNPPLERIDCVCVLCLLLLDYPPLERIVLFGLERIVLFGRAAPAHSLTPALIRNFAYEVSFAKETYK